MKKAAFVLSLALSTLAVLPAVGAEAIPMSFAFQPQ